MNINESTYWQDRVSQYAELNSHDVKGRIFFVGDSLVDRMNIEEFYPEIPVFNRGNAWDDTRSLLMRFEKTVLSGYPKKIILFIGGNDILYNVPLEQFSKNINNIISQSIKSNIEIIMMSLLPVRNDNRRKNNDIIKFNLELRKRCNENNVKYIDLFEKFLSKEGELKRKYTSDGVHLNGEGYKYLSIHMKSILE